MRHSARPRNMSAMRKEKRPAWSAVRRLQRATSRRGPSVSAAPLLMGCILGTHGPYVYPPRAQARARTGIYPQAPRLVGPRRTRLAMAQDARSVPRARVRVHAAADTGEPRGGVLSAVSRALPGSRESGASAAARGERGLGWAGILCARAESALAGQTGCGE